MIATNLEQGKKLLELGIDPNTADVFHVYEPLINDHASLVPKSEMPMQDKDIPAWSLSALLQYLREVDFFPEIEVNKTDVIMKVFWYDDDTNKALIPVQTTIGYGETFIDACVDLVVKLKEAKCI